jgi:hypothetical protein
MPTEIITPAFDMAGNRKIRNANTTRRPMREHFIKNLQGLPSMAAIISRGLLKLAPSLWRHPVFAGFHLRHRF